MNRVEEPCPAVPALEGPEEFHVLISHHAAQQEVAEEVQGFLGSVGLISRRTAGAAEPVKRLVWRCRVVLLLLSEEYSASPETLYEGSKAEAKARELAGDHTRLICLTCHNLQQTPRFLRGYQQVALADQNYRHRLRTLLTNPLCPGRAPTTSEQVSADTTSRFAAWIYYCGFLQLVLPKLSDEKLSIRDRIRNDLPCYEDNPRNMPRRMLLLVPSGGFFPPCMSDKDPGIIDAELFLHQSAHRAGHQDRDYKNPVSTITDARGMNYHCVLEVASPVLTMYEMAEHAQCGAKKEDLEIEVCRFYYALKEVVNALMLDNHVHVIYFPDDGRRLLSDLLLENIHNLIKKDIELEIQEFFGVNEESQTETEATGPRTFIPTSGDHVSTFLDLRMSQKYRICSHPRGIALVLNMMKFHRNSGLQSRRGATVDQENIERQLRKMDFDVHIYQDLTQAEMGSVLFRYSSKDHTGYDCFVCFILTHGSEGQVYGTDGESMNITAITNMFTGETCPSLHEKPKVFFIQACQGRAKNRNTPGIDNVVGMQRANMPVDELRQSTSEENDGATSCDDESCGEDIECDVYSHDASPGECDAAYSHDAAPGGCDVYSHDAAPGGVQSMLIPRDEHFLMSYATLPGRTSYRHTEMGSVYIIYLVEELRKYSATMDLEAICDQVRNKVKDDLKSNLPQNRRLNESQVPFKLGTLTKKLILNPRN